MNGTTIYPLPNTKPVLIPLDNSKVRIVISDGFHITKPKKMVLKDPGVYKFKVICAISDMQLLAGAIVTGLFYLLGMFTGILPIKIFSFLPILYFLLYYYLNREEFLQLRPV